ncbi:TldD/PmbA family protein [Leptothoe spongobia]|uniref:TldD/PmbA family protein n=1 Tax=Leptothoe spongobia TAU-MAC 1115 TaxID=1967444 RepID=A0A947GJA0_9CYAN|nr:metallopeptidase TldD-related protein [Leptothoe spongobia]MBT9316810.1 TldD/PmbA family protein [Leptothoe spongobia TAU-MAC 1115]
MTSAVVVAKQLAEKVFGELADAIASHLAGATDFTLSLSGENSQFTRFNRAHVRQSGQVNDGNLLLTLMQDDRTASATVPFVGEFETDWPLLKTALAELQGMVPQLPVDPFLVLPTGSATSRTVHQGEILAVDQIASTLLSPVNTLDFTGIYAGGLIFRGYADSAGQRHWFESTSYSLDFSLFDPQNRAVKGTFAGNQWQQAKFLDKIDQAKHQLTMMARPAKTIERGQYRTYLAPAAVAELLHMFSWGGVGEADLQQGNSAFGLLRQGQRQLSPKFTLQENFEQANMPRFNGYGEVAPLQLPIIQQGQLVNSLVSSRSAKEYKTPSNYASRGEHLRAPEILTGSLTADQILPRLERGLYLSNLHYLNWSDHPNGRVTGMTRYACFWVENGEIVAPIENLRFDESLYHCFGDGLMDLTTFQETIPEIDTYDCRGLGDSRVPGILVDDFTYTL